MVNVGVHGKLWEKLQLQENFGGNFHRAHKYRSETTGTLAVVEYHGEREVLPLWVGVDCKIF